MEAEPRDESSSLTLPFLVDEKQHNGPEGDASANIGTAGTTSFFNTCFNGLNALSGSTFISLFLVYFPVAPINCLCLCI